MKKVLSVFMACLVLLSVPLSAAAAETSEPADDKAAVSVSEQKKSSDETVSTSSDSKTDEQNNSVNSPDVPPKPVSDRMIGDIDKDESITSSDALSALRASVNLEDVPLNIADVDSDGAITSNDSLLILRYSVGFDDGSLIGIRENQELINPDTIVFDKNTLTLNEGDSAKITATISPNNATIKFVTWTTSNSSVATVSNGTLKAVKAGKATITAKTVNGKTAVCNVTVKAVTINPTDIKLNTNSVTLEVGKSTTLTATVSPSNATNKSVTWTTSDSSIATISNGTVKAIKAGTAKITAKTVNGKTAVCNVTVKPATVNPTSIKLNTTAVPLEVGKSTTLIATVSPSNATNKSVTWTTSDSSVATVSNGTVKAIKVGSATITAKTVNGKTELCYVVVKAATVNPTGIKLNTTAVTLEAGKSTTLTATVAPSNATNKSVTWTTSNSSVATVSNGMVKAVKAGTATITAKTVNGKTATCYVTVKTATVNPTGISLNPTSVTLEAGKSTTLTATVSPSNATNKSVTWTTSNSSVATVSNGTVKAVKAGTTTITAKTSNGKTATCRVTVQQGNTPEVENCIKLINYIKSNPHFTNSSGNKGIKGTPADDTEIAIVYDSSADTILFICINATYANGTLVQTATTLEYDYRKGIVKDRTVIVAKDSLFGCQADATWKASEIKYKDTINYSTSSVNIADRKVQNFANTWRDVDIMYSGLVVSVYTNMTLADIGFTKYMS